MQSSWHKVKKRLEAEGKIGPGLTLKGLRHTMATILAEMGQGERTIADVLGQKTTEMARHYSRRAKKTKWLDGIGRDLEKELIDRHRKVVNPDGKLSTP